MHVKWMFVGGMLTNRYLMKEYNSIDLQKSSLSWQNYLLT